MGSLEKNVRQRLNKGVMHFTHGQKINMKLTKQLAEVAHLK